MFQRRSGEVLKSAVFSVAKARIHGRGASCFARTVCHDENPQPGMSKCNPVDIICKKMATQKWGSHMQKFLNTYYDHLTLPVVMKILSSAKTSLHAYRFFKWTQDKKFKHDAGSFYKIIEILGQDRLFRYASSVLMSMPRYGIRWEDRVFNSMIRSYGRAGAIKEAIGIFMKMKELRVSPTVMTYNNCFTVLLNRGRTNMVKKHYMVMLNEGVLPDVYTYNILIRGFCLSNKVSDALKFFQEMRSRNCKPDIVTYNCLLDGLWRNGMVDSAVRLWRGMRKISPDVMPNVVTYTTMISGYCRKGYLNEALRLMNDMTSVGVKPNEVTYNTVIHALCDSNMFDKTHKIIEEMIEADFKPDTCTFNILINAQCGVEKLNEAKQIFDRMLELGVQPNSSTYSTLIRGLCSQTEFDKAVELLDDLMQRKVLFQAGGSIPVVASYNPILKHLCGCGKTGKAEKLFRQLLAVGVQDPSTFRTLILGHCNEGTPKAGLELLKEMQWRNYTPDIDTFNALMLCFVHNGHPAEARDTLVRMLECGHLPSASTFHMLIDSLFKCGRLQAASRVMKTMLERNVRQDIDISTRVLAGLFCQGFVDEALDRIQLLYEKGYLPNMDKLFEDLSNKFKYSEAQKLLFFILEKDCYLDIEYYNSVLKNLCNSGKAVEAFSLFYTMTYKGKKPERDCYELLIERLKDEGKTKEADFVSKRLRSIDEESSSMVK